MDFHISIGSYQLGMVDAVSIHRSVELLADTATIRLPASAYCHALEVEDKLHRGDAVSIHLGYQETGIVEEFTGYLQRVSTDDGSITLTCEDNLFTFRRPLANIVLQRIALSELLAHIIAGIGENYTIDNSYAWTYEKFVIQHATAYDVLKKVQEECGADIYLAGNVLHVHPPGTVVGKERIYDFAKNVEKTELTYHKAEEKKVQVVVKALLPDGKVREVEVGTVGGEKIEVRSPTSDEASMQARGEAELLRRSFDGYEGSITTWLIPYCTAGDTATLHDEQYPQKNGTYFVRSVTTEFSAQGGSRKIALGFRLS